eukprot:scaffold1616_cov310-Pinguiococcus_pyrenoidosus.AAC.39
MLSSSAQRRQRRQRRQAGQGARGQGSKLRKGAREQASKLSTWRPGHVELKPPNRSADTADVRQGQQARKS